MTIGDDIRRDTEDGDRPAQPPEASRSLYLLILYVGVALYVLSPSGEQYPAALATIVTFSAVPIVTPTVRRHASKLCPSTWLTFAFFLQLVVVPLLICFFGAYAFTLPATPPARELNHALVLEAIGYVAFCIGYSLRIRHSTPLPSIDISSERTQRFIRRWTIPAFVLAGVLGLYLSFGGVAGVGHYFFGTNGRPGGVQANSSSVSDILGLVLRPFLGFAIVIAFANGLDRAGGYGRLDRRKGVGLLLLAGAGLIAIYGTYDYNRGAFVAPIVALAAVYLRRSSRRLPLLVIVAVCIAGLYGLTAIRAYRTTELSASQVFNSGEARSSLVRQVDVNHELQVYGGGAQFLAFMLDKSPKTPYLGSTLVASVLSPLPSLGKSFRLKSATAIYNAAIYGPQGFVDQVPPFEGELIWNFGLLGLVAGLAALGGIAAELQRRFAASPTSLEAFCWMYAAVWFAFLVPGGVGPVAQVLIYFFGPVYFFALLAAVRGLAKG